MPMYLLKCLKKKKSGNSKYHFLKIEIFLESM